MIDYCTIRHLSIKLSCIKDLWTSTHINRNSWMTFTQFREWARAQAHCLLQWMQRSPINYYRRETTGCGSWLLEKPVTIQIWLGHGWALMCSSSYQFHACIISCGLKSFDVRTNYMHLLDIATICFFLFFFWASSWFGFDLKGRLALVFCRWVTKVVHKQAYGDWFLIWMCHKWLYVDMSLSSCYNWTRVTHLRTKWRGWGRWYFTSSN